MSCPPVRHGPQRPRRIECGACRGSHLATLCRKHFAGFGTISLIPAKPQGATSNLRGRHSDCRCSWAGRGPDCWTPFIIAIAYTACDASTDCISKLGIFLPARLILQYGPFRPSHTETSTSADSTWMLTSWTGPSAVTRAVSYKSSISRLPLA